MRLEARAAPFIFGGSAVVIGPSSLRSIVVHGLAALALALFGACSAEKVEASRSALRFASGNEPSRARADFDDRSWKELSPSGAIPSGTGVFWLRWREFIPVGTRMRSVHIGAQDAFELFWDGERLPLESPTRTSFEARTFTLSDSAARPGWHVVAMSFPGGSSAAEPLRYFVVTEAQKDAVLTNHWRWQVGDDASWAAPGFDDSRWATPAADSSLFQAGDFSDLPRQIFWLRTGVILAPPPAFSSKMLFLALAGAREVFWDGELIARSGKPGASVAEEIPGVKTQWIPVPDRLASPGYHQLAIRLSSQYRKPPGREPLIWSIHTADNPAYVREHDTALPQTVAIGLIAVVTLLYLFLFVIADRKMSFVLLGLPCGCFAASIYLATWPLRDLSHYTYDRDFLRELGGGALSALTTFFVIAFLLTQIGVRRRALWLTVTALAMAGATVGSMYANIEGWLDLIVVISLLIVFGRFRRKRGSALVLAGVAACVLVLFLGQPLYFNFGIFALFGCLLLALALHLREQREKHQQALLIRARLETELLKHSIQPHFLMNTLNALVDWVEENPRKGVQFIQEIGRHFDLLLRASGRVSIPIREEIQLCASFLAIMSYREEVEFRLDVVNVDDTQTVPPCIFHTLAENGVTHNRYSAPTVVFTLRAETTGALRRYYFETPIAQPSQGVSRPRGTGFKYVEARLEESYPGRWALSHTSSDTLWRTTLELRTS